ncbi:MAG: porin family protein [Rickettsiales bacterium]|nr:porin family protein [Pseudomonadota bacterium]MDA0966520.1 porin family protein [Pseudomonadota bacterium]MDG4543382.1 porin family protein [Rickettsiales bacterium]MDG4545648.1 porin family protein [Rickettsiales bacterium]MDG4548097.1 porin family protein [Rickettsiales bacterium]
MINLAKIFFIILFVSVANNSNATAYNDKGGFNNEGKKYISIRAEYVDSFNYDADYSILPDTPMTFNYDNGYGFGVALGYYVDDNVRIEGELTYRPNETKSLTIGGTEFPQFDEKMKLWNWMANAYYTVPLNKYVSPYIGGGFGLSYDSAYNGEHAFAYQAMTGLDFDIDYSSAISLGYRYFGTTEFEYSGTDDLVAGGRLTYNVKQHIYEVSYRLKF